MSKDIVVSTGLDLSLPDEADRGKLAFYLEDEVKNLRQSIGVSVLQLGFYISQIRDKELYVELGYGSVNEWLSSPEIAVNSNFGHVALSIYDFFIAQKQISADEVAKIDSSKLRDILPVVKKYPNDFDKWFDMAKDLRRIDLRREIKKLKISEKQQSVAQAQPVQQTSGDVLENKFLFGSFDEQIKNISDRSVDAVITRLPVYVTQSELKKRNIHPQHVVVPDHVNIVSKYNFIIEELTRVLKPEGAMCLVVNYENMFQIGAILENWGHKIIRDIVWFKSNISSKQDMLRMLKVHKTAIWASSAVEPTYNFTESTNDVWQIDNDNFFFDQLASMITFEGQLILDPFASEHTVVDVVAKLKRKWLGIDSSMISDVV